MNECKHAQKVVCQFKSLLDDDAIKAIGSSTLGAIRSAADISDKAAKDIIHIIERY